MGTLKDLPKDTPPTENHVTMHIPIQDRVLISSPRVRTSLKQYTKDGLSHNTFAVLIANLNPSSLHEYVVNGNTSVVNGEIITYHPINQHLLSILKYLSTTEPITGIFQFPILNEAELLLVVDLAAGIPANIKQIEMYIRRRPISNLYSNRMS